MIQEYDQKNDDLTDELSKYKPKPGVKEDQTAKDTYEELEDKLAKLTKENQSKDKKIEEFHT